MFPDRTRRPAVLGGLLYMVRATIWRGPLSGPDSSRPVRDTTLEPPRRGLGFLGIGANWPGILLMAIGAVLLVSGGRFLASATRGYVSNSPARLPHAEGFLTKQCGISPKGI